MVVCRTYDEVRHISSGITEQAGPNTRRENLAFNVTAFFQTGHVSNPLRAILIFDPQLETQVYSLTIPKVKEEE